MEKNNIKMYYFCVITSNSYVIQKQMFALLGFHSPLTYKWVGIALVK